MTQCVDELAFVDSSERISFQPLSVIGGEVVNEQKLVCAVDVVYRKRDTGSRTIDRHASALDSSALDTSELGVSEEERREY